MQSNGLPPSTSLRLPYYYSLPPSFATEQDYLSIWFVVPGDPAPPAEVNIRFCHKIDGLKEAINEKRIRLGYQLVPGMVLWKLKTPIPLCRRTGAERIAFARKINEICFPDPDLDEGIDGTGPVHLLDEVEDVSHYWEIQPKPKHLHIVVQAPTVARPSKTRPEDEAEAYPKASNSKAFEGRLEGVNSGDASNPASTSSALPDSDDERDGDGSEEEHRETSEAGSASPSEEPTPNSPPRRSLRNTVQTEKVLGVKGNARKSTVKFLPYDSSKHSSWAKKCNRCTIRHTECFGPVYRVDGTLSSPDRCHRCAVDHHRCEKGIFRKPSSPGPPGETIIVRPRAAPPVDRPSTSNARFSAQGASSSKTASGKRHIRLTPKVAAAKMQAMDMDDSFGTPSRKRPAVKQPVDSLPSFSKVARTSRTSLVPRHTGSDSVQNNSYHIPPRTSPSPLNLSHSTSEPPEDNPILIRLDALETSIFGDHDARVRRLADIRRLYHKMQQDKGA